MSLYKYYSGASGGGKFLIIAGTIAAGAIAWFGIVNPVRKLIIKKLDESKTAKEGKEASQALSDLVKLGIEPTITDAQAESFSNSLVSAFGGCGTDEDAIYYVMSQLKNDADVYKLINKYGTRTYDGCLWGSGQNKSLSGAISDELDVFEKAQVNAILKKNGVSFQFT